MKCVNILSLNILIQYLECGLTFYEPNEKIVGGVEANPRSWPSTVYIS